VRGDDASPIMDGVMMGLGQPVPVCIELGVESDRR
jgi:hypothetical protein